MECENRIRHKEYIKKMGYTIQNELSDYEGNVTYFVEQGNQYVMQVITLLCNLFRKEKS